MKVSLEFQTKRADLIGAGLAGVFPVFTADESLPAFLRGALAGEGEHLGETIARSCGQEIRFSKLNGSFHFGRFRPWTIFSITRNEEKNAWEVLIAVENRDTATLISSLEKLQGAASPGMIVSLDNEDMPIHEALMQLHGAAAAA